MTDMSAGDANTAGRHPPVLEIGGPAMMANGDGAPGSPARSASTVAASTPPEPSSPVPSSPLLNKARPPVLQKRTWSREGTGVSASPSLGPNGTPPSSLNGTVHGPTTPSLSAEEFTQMLIEDQNVMLPELPGAALEAEAEDISDKLSERRGDLPEPRDLVNRELSWIEFNKRVLAMAEREDIPLLERVGCSIQDIIWTVFEC